MGGGTEDLQHDESNDEPNVEAIEPEQRINQWIPNSRYRKQQKQIRKQPISIVFNYSSIVLTADMEKILNRGLNFAILPLNLDITQVLVDFKRFERSFVWKEFWFGKNIEEPYVQPLFKTTKTNLPKNYKVPN